MSSVTDPFEARRAVRADGLLRAFNDAGLLSASDVHVAMRLGALGGEEDEVVKLAAAFAVRGPRLGHVFVDLETIRDRAAVESDEPVDLSALPWPAPDGWVSAVRGKKVRLCSPTSRGRGSWRTNSKVPRQFSSVFQGRSRMKS